MQTLREITDQEHNVAALKQAIKDKEVPLKVAQTRLYQRSHRPNVELCRDAAQFRYEPGVGQVTAPPPTQVPHRPPSASGTPMNNPHHTHHPENVLRRHWGLMLAQFTRAGICTFPLPSNIVGQALRSTDRQGFKCQGQQGTSHFNPCCIAFPMRNFGV